MRGGSAETTRRGIPRYARNDGFAPKADNGGDGLGVGESTAMEKGISRLYSGRTIRRALHRVADPSTQSKDEVFLFSLF